jgi:hypothetical protein
MNMARRKSDRRSRGEITERIEKHQTDMREKGDQIGKSVSDVELERQTRDQLDLGGTSEAAEAIERALDSAEDTSVKEFDAESQALDQVHGDAEGHETELRERSDAANTDLDKLSDAGGRLHGDSSNRELLKAQEEDERDIEFLKEQEARAREAREESKRLHEEHQRRISAGGDK